MSKLKDIFTQTDNLDKKSLSFLIKALDSNNIDGFDYLEFKQSLQALKGMKLDNNTAIKSAFATASTMGLDKEKLMKSGNFYRNVLHKEKEKFDNALQKQVEAQIDGKKKKITQLQDQKSKLIQKIEDIKNKVAQIDQVIEKANTQIEQSELKIKDSQSRFEEAFEQLTKEIDSDLSTFDQTL